MAVVALALLVAPDLPPFAAARALASVQATYYVSPTGSGSTCSLSLPCSFTGAQAVVRTVNSSMTGDIVVYVEPGTYTVTSPITFNENDSGTNGYTVRYENYGSVGSAVFLGGQAVTGWSLYSGNIYRSYVGTSWAFNDLWENGRRAVKARTPNVNSGYGVTTTSQGPWLKNIEYNDSSTTTFKYNSGDLNPAAWNLSDVQINIFGGGYYNWNQNLLPVSSVDTTNDLVTLSRGADYPFAPGGRYFAQGDLSMLDSPGEYFLDQTNGYLYYYPRNTPIANQTIVAPTVQDIFRFVGSSQSALIHNVALQGLSLDYSDYLGQDPVGKDQIFQPDAMIYLKNTNNITIEDCHLQNAGLSGIFLDHYNEYDTLYGNWIEQTGISGIGLIGYSPTESGTADVNNNNVIENNKIDYTGMHSSYSAGIYMLFTGHDVVSHNQVSYSTRWLIGGGTWFGLSSPSLNYFVNNYFGYNDLYGGCQDTADCGAFDFGGGPVTAAQANTVEQMTISHVNWDPNADLSQSGSPANIGLAGVYFDNDNDYWNASNINVTDVQTWPYLANGTNENLTNVSWNAGYNDSLMDYKNIGLLADFPAAYGNGGYVWANDNDPGIAYTGSWSYQSGPSVVGDLNDDETYSDTPGDSLQYTFNGTEVRWISATSNNRGMASVYIDGTLDATVDTYTPTTLRQHVVYDRAGLSDGQHTIKIVVSSSKNASSGGYYIVIDGIGATSNYVNDNLLTYAGGDWYVNTGVSGDYNGDEHYTDIGGDYATYTFDGTGVTWLASTSNNRGEANVYIDGVLDATADLYTATTVGQNPVYSTRNLNPGLHTIKIVASGTHDGSSGGNYVTIDALVVTPDLAATYVNDSGLAYAGGDWYTNTGVSGDFDGDEHYTTIAGDYATYSFTGSQVDWFSATAFNRGKADVYIDGVFDATVDLYTASTVRQSIVYTKTGLAYGAHTIKIVARSDKNSASSGYNVVIDALEYR